VTCGLRAIPPWKAAADFVFAQVSYSVESLLRWRESVRVPGPVYAGVMVLASAAMARNLAGTIPDIDIPGELVAAVERDRDAGVRAACQQVLEIRDSGAFDGVHLVPVSRYRQVAALLETELRHLSTNFSICRLLAAAFPGLSRVIFQISLKKSSISRDAPARAARNSWWLGHAPGFSAYEAPSVFIQKRKMNGGSHPCLKKLNSVVMRSHRP
jgi:hypothetical protein